MGKTTVEVKLNSSGVRELLKSAEMQNILKERASEIASRAGQDCEVYVAQTRAVAGVRTTSAEGNKNNKLLKAVKG